MNQQQKADFTLVELKKHFPNIDPPLNHGSAFQLLVAVILSAQCTDVRVNMVTPYLFEYYPTPEKMADADIEHLKELVKSTGFYNNKSKNIKATAQKIMADFGGEVPGNMDDLLTLPGVARKTANVVLGQWFGINEGIAVDTHVIRISRLIGLTEEKSPEKIEIDLMKLFPKDEWRYISLGIIMYGREVCPAKKHDYDRCYLGGHGEIPITN